MADIIDFSELSKKSKKKSRKNLRTAMEDADYSWSDPILPGGGSEPPEPAPLKKKSEKPDEDE